MMPKHPKRIPNQQLRDARLSSHWTQQELADRLGTTTLTIGRWERREMVPSAYFQQKLCVLFNKSIQELGLLSHEDLEHEYQNTEHLSVHQDSDASLFLPSRLLWTVPYYRNPFFTGREEIFSHLHDAFHASTSAAFVQVQAFSGLGGVGKTQNAIEYAYRYRNDYSAVLWLRAETPELLLTDVVELANVLKLPESNEQNQQRVVEGVKQWLGRQDHWLLILDNVEDMFLVQNLLPSHAKGHTLVTTRVQATGMMARSIDLEPLYVEEGALFLLRRAKILPTDASLQQASETQVATAKEISLLMDGLPLALDQAGAYIEETGCTLSAYQAHYQTHQLLLLDRRGIIGGDHLHSVRTTFSLCFEKVGHANAAAHLLQLCAFFAADAIPEEMFVADGFEDGSLLQSLASDPVAFDDALATLRTYSLLNRNAETRTLTVHRLVQSVLRETMHETMQHSWAEQAVKVVNHALPEINGDALEFQHSSLFPHASQCAVQIERHQLLSLEAGHLLTTLADYEQAYAQYKQAEQHLVQAQEMYEHMNEMTHPEMSRVLSVLAKVYYKQGKYTEAKQYCHRSLTMSEPLFDDEHPNRADCLTTLALTHRKQGSYAIAEPLFRRVLLLYEQQVEHKQLEVAISLNNLGLLLCEQGKYNEAELLLRRSIVIREQLIGTEHLQYANSLHNLAVLYIEWGKYTEAKRLFQQALVIREKHLREDHPEIAITYNNLCRISYLQEDYTEAEQCIRRALLIHERIFGQDHLEIATALNNLAKILMAQGHDVEAEPFFQRTLHIYERDLGHEHPYRAITLGNLALLYTKQKRWSEAACFFQQSLAIHEKTVGLEHPHVAQTLQNMALLFLEQEQYEQAVNLHQQALALQEKVGGREHPLVVSMQEHYQEVYQKVSKRNR